MTSTRARLAGGGTVDEGTHPYGNHHNWDPYRELTNATASDFEALQPAEAEDERYENGQAPAEESIPPDTPSRPYYIIQQHEPPREHTTH
eukprot:CAMPEP_0170198664 /NCGR_PEP_ID=MMETSP0040_2-20121228/68903_1 /TAXON_ID=641309 /ORGANISM="Lotharella oceanica, Strain CCMP622" /LENGTH=89 /DNA_ID=CAMNT_0010448689 /DNA_START=956 /DNA_END=1229 /DNA_ORIENTATION=-